ncbi:uncharacterized protein LOC127157562 [Labeo rohita]|uniref:uncharacterized protein LOC127157562 n=1 Tax=Labeo rohita TaxID=84645 RepID=UPI0021E2015A|nr:uncharacterized protein LOC127157562 [Labeo rohita]
MSEPAFRGAMAEQAAQGAMAEKAVQGAMVEQVVQRALAGQPLHLATALPGLYSGSESLPGLDEGTGALPGLDGGTGALSGLDMETGALYGLDLETGALSGQNVGTGVLSGLDSGAEALPEPEVGTVALSGLDLETGALSGSNVGTAALSGLDLKKRSPLWAGFVNICSLWAGIRNSNPPWACEQSGGGVAVLTGKQPADLREEHLHHFQDVPPPNGGGSVLCKVLTTAGGKFLETSWSHPGTIEGSSRDLGTGAKLCPSPEKGASFSEGCARKGLMIGARAPRTRFCWAKQGYQKNLFCILPNIAQCLCNKAHLGISVFT